MVQGEENSCDPGQLLSEAKYILSLALIKCTEENRAEAESLINSIRKALDTYSSMCDMGLSTSRLATSTLSFALDFLTRCNHDKDYQLAAEIVLDMYRISELPVAAILSEMERNTSLGIVAKSLYLGRIKPPYYDRYRVLYDELLSAAYTRIEKAAMRYVERRGLIKLAMELEDLAKYGYSIKDLLAKMVEKDTELLKLALNARDLDRAYEVMLSLRSTLVLLARVNGASTDPDYTDIIDKLSLSIYATSKHSMLPVETLREIISKLSQLLK